HDAMLAAHAREFARGFGVLDGGEQPPGGRVVPGLLALAPPLLDQLAERLIEQQQGNAILAAGVAGLFEHGHVAETRDLIEQEQDAALYGAVRLVGGVEQRADDDAAESGRRLQGFQWDLNEESQLAAGNLTGRK